MKGSEIFRGKGHIVWKILKIFVFIGWLAFLLYVLYIIRLMGSEYAADPSNFVFFEDEQQRVAYRSTLLYGNQDWVEQASLIDQCKPLVYLNDFYFSRIDLFIRLTMLLILLTLITKIDLAEWKIFKGKFDKFADKLEEEDEGKDV